MCCFFVACLVKVTISGIWAEQTRHGGVDGAGGGIVRKDETRNLEALKLTVNLSHFIFVASKRRLKEGSRQVYFAGCILGHGKFPSASSMAAGL